MNRSQAINGLTWSLAETEGEVVSVYLWCATGACDEQPQQAGAAHFVEHMLFKGTHRHAVGDIAKEIEGFGGDINAYTSHDETVLHATVPVEAWRETTTTLFDMFWASTFTPDAVRAERDVILEEVASYLDDPHSVVEDASCALLFGAHAYGRPVIGTHETVESLSHEQLVAFWTTHYAPNRCHLAIAGPLAHKDVERWLRAHVPMVASGAPISGQDELATYSGRRRHVPENFDTQLATLAWRGPPSSHPDQASLAVLASLMGQGHASVLDVHLTMRDALASDVWCEQDTMKHASVWSALLLPLPGTCNTAIHAALEHIEALRHSPPLEDAVERAKAGLLTDLLFTNETTDGVAHDMAWHQHHGDSHTDRLRWPAAIEAVTPLAVMAAANRWLPADRAVITSVGPEAPEAAPRSYPSAKAVLRDTNKPDSEGVGIRRRAGARDGVAALHVACFGGGLLERARTAGTGLAWSQTLLSGTQSRTEEELVVAIDELGAAVEPYVTKSVTGITMTLPAKNAQRGAELLGEILTQPTLGGEAWSRNRVGMQEEHRSQDDRAGERMNERAWQRLWSHHPWRLPASGTPASLERITSAGLQRYHRRCFDAGAQHTMVSGDVDSDLILDIFRRWLPEPTGLAHPCLDTPEPRPRPGHARLKAGHQQTLLAWNVITPSPRDPRHYALALGNLVLGGQSGRLFDALRERNPLAYSVWATRSAGHDGGISSYGLATTPEQWRSAKRLLYECLQRMADDGPTERELTRAKRMMLGAKAMGLQRASGRAAAELQEAMYGLTRTRRQLEERLAPITRADVHAAMESTINSDGLWTHVMPS